MTIKECIDIVDSVKPNQYSLREKVMWLSFIDETIINDVLKTHEGYDGRYDDFTGYTEEKLSVPLIVKSPYDRLYTAYLKMKIDGENGETARYNNSASMFNTYFMEYRKYYNKTHLPISATDRKPVQKPAPSGGLTKAELENLKRELYYLLSDDIAKRTSGDKIQDIVKSWVNTNIQMLKGKDGVNGTSITHEWNGNTLTITSASGTSRIYLGGSGGSGGGSTSRISYVTLESSKWKGSSSPYSQVVTISGTTPNSKIDINPTVEQLSIFHYKDLAFVVEDDKGKITVYCIGQKPENDYTMQVTITEVAING
jgi:hypothetical protein